MTQATNTTTAAPEITGIRSAISRVQQIAAAHAKAGADEGFLGSLNRMQVGDADQQAVRDALEASQTAAMAWAAAAESLTDHNLPLQEAYATSPQAANKHANTNE